MVILSRPYLLRLQQLRTCHNTIGVCFFGSLLLKFPNAALSYIPMSESSRLNQVYQVSPYPEIDSQSDNTVASVIALNSYDAVTVV